jgi:bla regulator protein blaR1
MNSTPDFMPTLAWSLLHFLWQGAAIAAVAAAFMVALRQPATRYLVGITALALMLCSFLVTFALLSAPAATVADVGETGAPAAAPASFVGATANSVNELMGERAAMSSTGDFAWIARGWLIGVFVFALRMAFGLAVIEYLRRRNLIALPDALVGRFRALQQRLGIRRVIRYCECHSLSVPAVIGLFRPIVLLPMRAMTGLSPEQLEAVIAHELGHIKRFDVAVNFFQVIAETLFFFHPAVWWLNRRIRADREDCCDDVAIAACGGTVAYARALATMETWRTVPSFAMAATGSPVAARVMRLLGVSQQQNGARTAGLVTASLVLATALVAAGVSFGVTTPALAQAGAGSSQQIELQQETEEVLQEDVQTEEVQTEEGQVSEEANASKEPKASKPPRAPAAPKEPAPTPPPSPANPRSPANPPAPATAPPPASPPSFINEMNSVGLENLDAEELIALRVQGITPAYIREIRSTGLNPDVNVLVAMKVHGITPDYVSSVRALGFTPNEHDLIAMKVHDITPEYVRELRAAGFNPSTHEIIAMKVHGITPDYRKMLEDAGYKLSASQLVSAKVMGVSPEFIQLAAAHGFKNLTFDRLIALKNADVL